MITVALDISTSKIGVAVFNGLTCTAATVLHFDSADDLEVRADKFEIAIKSFLLSNVSGSVDTVAYEAPLIFIRGRSTANIVTKLAAFNLLCRWITWSYLGRPNLVAIPVMTYKAYFNKTVFTAQEVADSTIKNLSESKMYNLAVANRLLKQHVCAPAVAELLLKINKTGGAAKGVDDVADAIVVGFYCALHDGKCQPKLSSKRRAPKGTARPVRRPRRLANR
jgi:hypothetical protein